MSTRYTCDDGETLVAYLYDEIDPALRDDVARHLSGCERCRDEAAALGGVRRILSEWTPPAPPLRFTLVSEAEASNVLRPRVPAWQTLPRWAQLAAAMLVLAVGAAVANVEVRRDAQGWTVSTGWMPAAPAAVAPADAEVRQAVARLEQSVRDLAARPAVVQPAAAPAAADTAPAVPDAALIARVRAMLEASERRQEQQLAVRLTQLGQDFDIQRRADLVRIERGLGQLEGRTRAAVTEQGEMLNMIVRAGLRPPQ
jgi:hypothetical protein